MVSLSCNLVECHNATSLHSLSFCTLKQHLPSKRPYSYATFLGVGIQKAENCKTTKVQSSHQSWFSPDVSAFSFIHVSDGVLPGSPGFNSRLRQNIPSFFRIVQTVSWSHSYTYHLSASGSFRKFKTMESVSDHSPERSAKARNSGAIPPHHMQHHGVSN
jgi:hypothetical protein